MKYQFMSPQHPKWGEFTKRLEGPEGCNFRRTIPEDSSTTTWKCGGGTDKSLAIKILRLMGFDDKFISCSLEYFESVGGFCDCEILFNVKPRRPRRKRKVG